ncbi:hypothetical protein FOA52_012629 [Chlamydomonas sp. UWO 241]|nr:hypothetical protein FOA52_012629 [Chlamydomonas sp. UWO 241]
MMAHTFNNGDTALLLAAGSCRVDALRALLDHPSAAAMLSHANSDGCTVLTNAAKAGHLDVMRLLLDHPAAMVVITNGSTVLMVSVENSQLDVMRLLLDHPSAAAMLAVRTPKGASALTVAAGVAAGSSTGHSSFAPLLLLLRRVDLGPQPCAAEQAHMTKVLKTCHGHQKALLNIDQPDAARDECVRLLLAWGAEGLSNTTVAKRIVRELAQMAGVPHLINEAIVGLAAAQKRPRDGE